MCCSLVVPGSVPVPVHCAGIFKQSMGAIGTEYNRVVIPARQATHPGRIDSLESTLGLIKSLEIRALDLEDSALSYMYTLQ